MSSYKPCSKGCPKTGASKTTTNGYGGGTGGHQLTSPFSNSPIAPSTPSSSCGARSPSPRVTELPVGVRYVRQTPQSIYSTAKNTAAFCSGGSRTITKSREPSPAFKSTRFAEPLTSTIRSNNNNGTASSQLKSSERVSRQSRPLYKRPVIPPANDVTDDHKIVSVSPATKQSSPIFSTGCVFGGDGNDKLQHKNGIQLSKESFPDSDKPSPRERQTIIKSVINAPDGTVKRSSVITPNDRMNVHKNTYSVPLYQLSSDGHNDQNRLSVNVNVAVGLECDDEKAKRKHRYVDDCISEESESEPRNYSDELDSNVAQSVEGSKIQVAVRLRPFISEKLESVVEMSGNTVRIINTDNDNYNRLEFGFDHCLNSVNRDIFEFADQDKVFLKMGRPLLDRAMEGYNVCMFAYGQTGSGKSYTMMGTDTNPGIIPRFVHEMYKRFQTVSEVVFTVEVSYCEIYNEKIYDLLSDDKNANKKMLRIREHPQTGPYVENLAVRAVESYNELMDLLKYGTRRRATASTAANDISSRSHAIFTINLSQMRQSDHEDLDTSCYCSSRVNLIDLAGSERVGHAGTGGERLKEGALINKSLLNLGKVITKLAEISTKQNKVAHVPYRDSQLTYLLKDSLGGNSRTSMIATISPAKCYLEETLSTLRYASTARSIVNYVHINEDPKTKIIRELLQEIEFLKNQQIMHCDQQHLLPPQQQQQEEVINDYVNDDTIDEWDEPPEEPIETTKPRTCTIATNTSFVTIDCSDRNNDNKTPMTTTQPPPEPLPPPKLTATIATNTSLVSLTNTGTEPMPTHPEPKPPQQPSQPKPKTKNTATEMSFSEKATITVYVDLPTPMDMRRTKDLENMQQKLLNEIQNLKEKLLDRADGWQPKDCNNWGKNDNKPTDNGNGCWNKENKPNNNKKKNNGFSCDNWGEENEPKGDGNKPLNGGGNDNWDEPDKPVDGGNCDEDNKSTNDGNGYNDDYWDAENQPTDDGNDDNKPTDDSNDDNKPVDDVNGDDWGEDNKPIVDGNDGYEDNWDEENQPTDDGNEDNWDEDNKPIVDGNDGYEDNWDEDNKPIGDGTDDNQPTDDCNDDYWGEDNKPVVDDNKPVDGGGNDNWDDGW